MSSINVPVTNTAYGVSAYNKTPYYSASGAPLSNFGGAVAPWGFENNNWLANPFNRDFGAVVPFGENNWGVAPFHTGDRFFDRTVDRAFRDFNRAARHFNTELNLHSSRPGSYLEASSLANPIRFDADGNRWLNCYFDLRSYKPEEVSVTLDSKNRFLNVEATHEVKDKEHYIKRSYSRKVYIPETVKCDLSKIELKSALNNEGLLCVEAALPRLSIEESRSADGSYKGVTPYSDPTVYKVNTKTI